MHRQLDKSAGPAWAFVETLPGPFLAKISFLNGYHTAAVLKFQGYGC